MTIKTKIAPIIPIMIVIFLSIIMVVCYATDDFDKNDPDTWYTTAKNGGVDGVLADQIKVGMTFDEIVGIIGKPQRDIGSGVWQMEWEMKSGEVLVVSFNSVTSDNYGSEPVSGPIEYNLVSYRIDIIPE